jgi:uncharacterized protein YndB with AHSA1/START domain
MPDAEHDFDGTRRRVEACADGTGRQTAVLTRGYQAAAEEVWDACTNPERVARWLMPLSGDLHVGGRYQLQGNAGGMIQRCEPPRALSITWEYGGETNWVDVRLSAAGGAVQLQLAHTVPDGPKWEEFGPGMVGPGWDLALSALAAELDHRTVDPSWLSSEDGERFIRHSSVLWRDAQIASGADPAEAHAAADRTAAFWCRPAADSVSHVGQGSESSQP